VPCHNEADNLLELARRLAEAFPQDGQVSAEFVIVNDGSTDETESRLAELAQTEPRLLSVHLPVRSGQTLALWEGLCASRGRWIAHLDGDLQNDPSDLPDMLRRAQENDLDAVLGYRATRRDNLQRRFASWLANTVRRALLRDTIRDIGCSTRVVKRESLERIEPFPNMHRYLPALVELSGCKFEQIPVTHHERVHGSSKYGNLMRGIQSFRDLPRVMRQARIGRNPRNRGRES
jgi:dolichol-phosphate mannosyltransferase